MIQPARVARTAGRLLGRRGAFLLAVGIAWIMYGAAMLLTTTPKAQVEGLTILTGHIPLSVWGWVWVASGAMAVATSPIRRVGLDQGGFTALTLPAGAWSAGYLIDWIFVGDYSRGWVTASTYAAYAASIIIVSGWPEVRRTRGTLSGD